MKLALHQLDPQLNKGIAPIYWVSGDEPFQIQQCLDKIHQAAQSKGFSEKVSLVVDSNFKAENLFEHTHSMSLFGDQKRIELIITGRPPAAFTKALTEYCKAPAQGVTLLIRSAKLTPKDQKTAWYKTVDTLGCFITIWPIEASQLPGWIQQQAKQRQLRLTPDACQLLADCTEGNLLAADQTLEKLIALGTDITFDADKLKQYVSDMAQFDVFQLADTVLSGNVTKALKMLAHLQKENVERTTIVWAITKDIRNLGLLFETCGAHPNPAAMQRLGIWPKRQPLFRQAMQRLNYKDCIALLAKAAELDCAIKGLRPEIDLTQAITNWLLTATTSKKVCA